MAARLARRERTVGREENLTATERPLLAMAERLADGTPTTGARRRRRIISFLSMLEAVVPFPARPFCGGNELMMETKKQSLAEWCQANPTKRTSGVDPVLWRVSSRDSGLWKLYDYIVIARCDGGVLIRYRNVHLNTYQVHFTDGSARVVEATEPSQAGLIAGLSSVGMIVNTVELLPEENGVMNFAEWRSKNPDADCEKVGIEGYQNANETMWRVLSTDKALSSLTDYAVVSSNGHGVLLQRRVEPRAEPKDIREAAERTELMSETLRYTLNYAVYLLSLQDKAIDDLDVPKVEGINEDEARKVRVMLISLPDGSFEELIQPFSDRQCRQCGMIHPPCKTCGAACWCSAEDPEPFVYCTACDSEMAGSDVRHRFNPASDFDAGTLCTFSPGCPNNATCKRTDPDDLTDIYLCAICASQYDAAMTTTRKSGTRTKPSREDRT